MDEKLSVINRLKGKIKRTERMIGRAEEMGRDPNPLRNQLAGIEIAKNYMEAEWRKLAEKVKQLEGECDGLVEG